VAEGKGWWAHVEEPWGGGPMWRRVTDRVGPTTMLTGLN
jgi:hypothetical protein